MPLLRPNLLPVLGLLLRSGGSRLRPALERVVPAQAVGNVPLQLRPVKVLPQGPAKFETEGVAARLDVVDARPDGDAVTTLAARIVQG